MSFVARSSTSTNGETGEQGGLHLSPDLVEQRPKQRDVTILRSLPGVGRIVLATLLGEAAEPLRKRDYHALRTLSGVAPVTRRSGKRCGPPLASLSASQARVLHLFK